MYSWKYVEGGRGVELVGAGVVLGSEILQANRELLEDKERLRALQFAIVLFDPAATLDLSTSQIQEIVEQDQLMAELNPNLRLAVVAEKDLDFGLARMWEGYVARVGWSTSVFRTRSEAERWLKGSAG